MRHHKDRREWYASHPKSLWIREDDLLDMVNEFFAERVFGPKRITAMRGRLAQEKPKDETAAKRLRKELLDLEKRQNNVLAQIEEHEPTGDDEIDRDFRERLQRRYSDLARLRKMKVGELHALTEKTQPDEDQSLLNELPSMAASFASLSEELQRRVFDAFNLELRYRVTTHEILIRITVKEDHLPAIAALTSKIADPPEGESATKARSLVLSAPGPALRATATSGPVDSRGRLFVEGRFELGRRDENP